MEMNLLQPIMTFRDNRGKRAPKMRMPREFHARASHRKTRMGCGVCKIRRVKCDETKPACMRCTSTGRKCEGYPVSALPSSKIGPTPIQNPHLPSESISSLSLYRLSSIIPGDYAERRSFYYLRGRAIYDISGYFESEFWNTLVLQISHTEPAVRYALLALSSLCETHESQDLTDDEDTPCVHFARQQYTKAVSLLADYLSTTYTRLDVILSSCLVFVWFEYMRNDLKAGLRHLKSGLTILNDFRQSSLSSSLMSQHIDASLIYLLSRLKTQATIYGIPIFGFYSDFLEESRKNIPTSFPSIEHARNSLHNSLATVFQFISQILNPDFINLGKEPLSSMDLPPLEVTYHMLSNQFRNWKAAVKNSPASALQSLGPNQAAAMCLLHLYHKTVTVLLETLFTHSQMIYDQHNGSFEQILTLAEQLIDHSQSMDSIIFFDMGVIAPLYYVVLKCRNIALRRKALLLLKLAPRREGIWNRKDAIEYAEWKIDIEERGRGQLSETDALPEAARVWNESMRDVIISGRRRTAVSFQWRIKDCLEFGEDITDLSTRMGQIL